MRNLYLIQAALLVAGSITLALAADWQAALSFALGASVVFANVALLVWVWQRLLHKKIVALPLLVIVFKYAILGIILYLILRSPWLSTVWFCVGLGTLMISAVGTALGTKTDFNETAIESEALTTSGLNS